MVTTVQAGGISLPAAVFEEVFPFFFAFEPDLTIVRTGRSLPRVCPKVVPGAKLTELFAPIRPETPFTFESIAQARESLFLIKDLASDVLLRGQIVSLDQSPDTLVFLGTPWLPDPAALARHGLSFDDFAIHDPALDLLQVMQSQTAAVNDLKKLADKLRAQRAALREANEKLAAQEREARTLALIAARTDNAVVLTDAQGRTLWVNEGFTRVTGYTLPELLGKKPGSVLQGPGTDPETVRQIGERLRAGQGFSAEILNYHKNGRSYWLAVEVQPIFDEQNRITNFMAVESDITARRAAQQRLAIQYAVSRVFSAPGDTGSPYQEVLRSVCVTLGWQVGQFWRLMGDKLGLLCSWHAEQAEVGAFLNLSREMQFLPGVGLPGRVWVTAAPAWIPDVGRDVNFPRAAVAVQVGLRGAFAFPVLVEGKVWGVVEFFSRKLEEPDEAMLKTFSSVGTQIGQFIVRREAERELRKAHSFQRAVLEASNYSIIATTPEGTIIAFNRAAEQMLGYSAEEVIGRLTPELLHDRDEVTRRARELTQELGREVPPGFEAFVAKARLGKPDEREWTYIRKDGTRFPVMLSVTAIQEETGDVTGYLGIAGDISEQKRVANELIRAKEAAEAASRAKGEFLATMSHEIRTPMNGVLGMTEFLLKSHLTSRQKEFAEGIASSANALLNVVDEVLDFSKIEAGKLSLLTEVFTLRPILDAVLEVVSHRDPDKRLVLAGIIHHEVSAKLKGDPLRLRQVLLNLVGNAVKFTERGEVVIRVTTASRSEEALILRFEIKDTGIGLTQEQLQRLFQPFVQADASSSRRFGGTGLGLAISRKLVELMGGKIGVRSELSKGSTFWFEIPFGRVHARPPQESHPALARARVLLGVKNPSLTESLLETFSAWGVPAVATQAPSDLLRAVGEAMAQNRVPFVVWDDEFVRGHGKCMPEGLSELKANAFLVLLSAPSGWDEESARHFNTVLFKPVKHSQLFDALVSALQGDQEQAPVPPLKTVSPRQRSIHAGETDRLSQLRILLAEDHQINRKLCLLMLEEFGARADTVENGEQVLATLTKQDYDLILMDCNMPELDGYEATKAIRQREATLGIPTENRVRIVALTANALMGERERCLGIGMDDFLTKPYTASELRDVILRCIRAQATSGPQVGGASRLTQLAAELDVSSVVLMVEDYLKDLPHRLAQVKSLLAQGNQQELERAAHSLKGVSAAFGLDDLAALFGVLEQAAETGDIRLARSQLAPLEQAANGAARTLREWLAGTSS